jgi:putative transposase
MPRNLTVNTSERAVCFDDAYLLAASLYIHMNPVKAGLASNPLDYRWSSCRLYCKDIAPVSFVDPEFILGLMPIGKSIRKTRYGNLLNRGGEVSYEQVLEQEDAIERFRSKLAEIFPKIFIKLDQRNRLSAFSGINIVGPQELENQIEKIKQGYFQSRPESRKAKKFMIEQLMARGFKRKEIAERLGISRKTVYNILKADV